MHIYHQLWQFVPTFRKRCKDQAKAAVKNHFVGLYFEPALERLALGGHGQESEYKIIQQECEELLHRGRFHKGDPFERRKREGEQYEQVREQGEDEEEDEQVQELREGGDQIMVDHDVQVGADAGKHTEGNHSDEEEEEVSLISASLLTNSFQFNGVPTNFMSPALEKLLAAIPAMGQRNRLNQTHSKKFKKYTAAFVMAGVTLVNLPSTFIALLKSPSCVMAYTNISLATTSESA